MLSYIKARNLQPITQVVELPPKLAPPPVPAAKPATAPTTPVAKTPPATTTTTTTADYTDIELTSMRTVIANRLTLSKVSCISCSCSSSISSSSSSCCILEAAEHTQCSGW